MVGGWRRTEDDVLLYSAVPVVDFPIGTGKYYAAHHRSASSELSSSMPHAHINDCHNRIDTDFCPDLAFVLYSALIIADAYSTQARTLRGTMDFHKL